MTRATGLGAAATGVGAGATAVGVGRAMAAGTGAGTAVCAPLAGELITGTGGGATGVAGFGGMTIRIGSEGEAMGDDALLSTLGVFAAPIGAIAGIRMAG